MSVAAPTKTVINILDHLPTKNSADKEKVKKELNTSVIVVRKRTNEAMNLKVDEELVLSDDEDLSRVPTPKHPDVIERERKIAE